MRGNPFQFIVAARIAASVEIEQQYRKADMAEANRELPIGAVRVDVLVPQRGAENDPALSRRTGPRLVVAAKERFVGGPEIERDHSSVRHFRDVMARERATVRRTLRRADRESGT